MIVPGLVLQVEEVDLGGPSQAATIAQTMKAKR